MNQRNVYTFIAAAFVVASLVAWLLIGDVFAGILLAVLAVAFKPGDKL